MTEDHVASTAAPPSGKEGINIAHAAATSAGAGSSSGPGGSSSTEEVYDPEEECEPCPKASRDHISNRKTANAGAGGGGGSGGLDGALRAERGSPYARPRKGEGAAKSPPVGRDAISAQSRRLYVGNLAYEVTWRELKDHMRGGGGGGTGENPETWEIVRADVLVGRDGRSRGCGIVEYGSSEEAAAAAGAMNDTELAGRKIFVREDREEGGSAAAASSSGGGGGPSAPSFAAAARAGGGEGGGGRSVYVGNLAYEVAWQDLKDHMRSAGDVLRAEVLAGRDGRSRGCGTVEYATSDGAARAMSELHDSELMGRPIFVREDRERRGVGGGDGGGNGNGGTGGGGGGGGGGGAREGDGVYLAGGGFQQHRVVVVGGGGGGGPMGNNALAGGNNLGVYVGNLAYEVTWQELKDHMRAAGNVDKADILKSADGRSKGCGIVMYQKSHEVARAIRELQNSELRGRPIFVREDREPPGGGSGGGGHHQQQQQGGGGGFGGYQSGGYYHQQQQNQNHQRAGAVPGAAHPAPAEGCQLFVGNLSWETGWRELKDHFRQCGDVDRAEVAEGSDGRKRGYGLIRYRSARDAANAIDVLNGVEFMGRPLEVRLDGKA